MSSAGSVIEVARVFLRLGCVSFGGPIAHLAYFRTELVERRRWLDDALYADIVALCQFLPGPASSQVVYAVGMHRAGLLGALAASICFTLPSTLLMIGFAYGLARTDGLQAGGWLHGLKLAAVAVVAQAVWSMGQRLCPDRARVSMCLAAAAVLLVAPSAWVQLAVIALGGLLGCWLYRADEVPPAEATPRSGRAQHVTAIAALATFVALLALLPAAARLTGSRDLAIFDSFYRAGALVFGGGHVVLPLIRAELVPSGLLTDDQFLAGYGAAQALPGPMFTFAAYAGAAMQPGAPSWRNGLWCVLAIFLPTWLIIGGALPFWRRLRGKRWSRSAVAGANAVVVGILLAALYTPLVTGSVHRPVDLVVVLVAFGLLEHWKAPPWLVVAGSAVAGQLL